jgi:hypothetical protein
MSVAAQRGAIAGFCNGLLGRSHALTVSAHVAIPLRDNQILVCWSAAASGLFRVTDNIQGSLDEYLDILRSQQFSAVLNDGGILQISYRYKRDKLIGHPLCFYPALSSFRPKNWKICRLKISSTCSVRKRSSCAFEPARPCGLNTTLSVPARSIRRAIYIWPTKAAGFPWRHH